MKNRAAFSPFVISSLVLAGLGAQACGREDVELAPITAPPPPPPEDCSASVPAGLLGARPPMGWNGYNAFECAAELDEAKLMAIVDALVASGMQSAGYRYVNLDACWELPRAADGQRVHDPARLPSGIAALSGSVHARGLSLGIFSNIQDCGRQGPGAEGHEAADVATFTAWGVDYLKYVQCGSSGAVSMRAVSDMAAALKQSARPILLSHASGRFQEWMRDTVQLWRTSGDVRPTWSSIVSQIDAAAPLAAYARPGAFNDPDMLELGNGTLTEGEQRVQFSVWSILSAPLLAGNDLTVMTEETRALLTNSRVIALNQDPLGLQAARIREGDIEVFAKPLAECGARGIVLWNRTDIDGEISVAWKDVWLEPGEASVRDLWTDSLLQAEPDGFTVAVRGHDAVALRVEGVEPPLPSGRVYLSDLKWTYATNGWGPVELDQTNGETDALDGKPIRLRGAAYPKGLGVHGPSLIRYRLGQRCSRFIADIGVDDDVDGQGSAQFEIWADGELLFKSGVLTGTSPASALNIDVGGRRELRLFVGLAGDGHQRDHSVWAGAMLECADGSALPKPAL